VLAGVVRQTNKEIVNVIRPGSEMLASLQEEFHVMLDARLSPASGTLLNLRLY
jgi:hypothetical protein